MKNKVNIIYLFPGAIYRPNLPDFKDRFMMLSERFSGEIYSWTYNDEYKEYAINEFVFKGIIAKKKGLGTKIRLMVHMIASSLKYNKIKKIDAIIAYDPMFTGFVGVLLKKFLKTKLIIELNSSDIEEAMIMEKGRNFKTRTKVFISQQLRKFSLAFADGIKLLTEKQKSNLEEKYLGKKVFCFHDFVPTHYFASEQRVFEKYILFIGFPFYRKGVDILVKAFDMISNKYPEFRLRLVGHLIEEEAKLYLGEWNDKIQFIKPMFYDALKEEFRKCYCLVLPSREEGMGRVLIEAMASGKPVIGANVGGIPDIVTDEKCGYLFVKEQVNELAEKLEQLLKDEMKARKMGDDGIIVVNNKFSSKKYIEFFGAMIDVVVKEDF